MPLKSAASMTYEQARGVIPGYSYDNFDELMTFLSADDIMASWKSINRAGR